jgi:aspartate/methionine/tyrosine aminotransferase
MSTVHASRAPSPDPSGPAVGAPPSGTNRKESPYLTWVKQLPTAEINLGGSAVPSCAAALLGPLESEPPLNERNDYGWPPLVARIAARYSVGEASVVVAAGTSMANHLAMATILERGDHVLVERPGYDPLERVPVLWGAHVDHVARVADRGYRFDVDAIRAAVTPRTRLVVLSDLHNPTGARLDVGDFRALTALAESRGFYVIVDEVYGEWLREEGVPSTIHVSPHVIVTSSLTKVWGLGGLRVGWVLADPALAERMRHLAGLFDNIIAHPSERLAVRALERSAMIIGPHKRLVAHNRALLKRWIENTPDVTWAPPTAGATAFVNLGLGDVWRFADTLARKHGTRVVPGHFFGAPEYVRIGLGVDSALLEHGLTRIGEELQKTVSGPAAPSPRT